MEGHNYSQAAGETMLVHEEHKRKPIHRDINSHPKCKASGVGDTTSV